MRRYLSARELNPVVYNDENPGVEPGSYEVRVPVAEASAAEPLVAEYVPDAPMEVDTSAELDLVTLATRMGATAEMEIIGMRSVLEAAGIPTVIVGDSTLPNLSFQVQVSQNNLAAAQQVLAEAEAAGPAAAIEAERESELEISADPQA